MSALSPLQLQETKDILAIPIYTRSAAKWAQTLKAGEIQGLIRNCLSQRYDMKYCNRTLCDWNCDCDVLLWVVGWVFNIMNVWYRSRLEHDCITTYSQVTHKIEMYISWEHQGAKTVNKINVQCVRINEHILWSYITWGNKKTAQPRFPWVIERNRGSYFYYLIGKKSPIFLSKFIKENYTQVPGREGGGYVWQMWKSVQWGNTFHTKNRAIDKSWNKNHIYIAWLLKNVFFIKFTIITSLVSKLASWFLWCEEPVLSQPIPVIYVHSPYPLDILFLVPDLLSFFFPSFLPPSLPSFFFLPLSLKTGKWI